MPNWNRPVWSQTLSPILDEKKNDAPNSLLTRPPSSQPPPRQSQTARRGPDYSTQDIGVFIMDLTVEESTHARDHARWGPRPNETVSSLEVRLLSFTKNRRLGTKLRIYSFLAVLGQGLFRLFLNHKTQQHEAQIAVHSFGPWLVFERFMTD